MRHFVFLACALVGCAGDSPGGSGNNQPDAGSGTPDSGGSTDSGSGSGNTSVCPLPMTTADTGALAATKTQMCPVAGTMNAKHWYRVAATLPGQPTDYVQIELWDGRGAFLNGAVTTGTFPVDTNPNTCGVCVRGLGDKGGAGAKEYFANAGSVTITALGTANGQPVTASLSGVTFAEIDANKNPVASGCTATVAASQLSGTVTVMGMGSGGCPATVGD